MYFYGFGFTIELFFLQKSEEWHRHEDTELIFLLEGELSLQIFERALNLDSGDIAVINSLDPHRIKMDAPVLCCRIFFSKDLLEQYFSGQNIQFVCNSALGVPEQYQSVKMRMYQLIDCCMKGKKRKDLDLTIHTLSLLQFLEKHFRIPKAEAACSLERSDELIAYISRNCGEELTLKELSRQFHLSYNYLSRYFKKTFGINFSSYLNKVRLERAAGLLLHTDRDITQIALECGFSSSSYLGKVFRSVYGISPKEYRLNYGKKLSPNEREEGQDPAVYKMVLSFINEQKQKNEITGRIIYRKKITADTNKKVPFPAEKFSLLTIGPAHWLCYAKFQEHLLKLRDDLGIRTVKFHGLFSAEMEVVSDKETPPCFDKIDEALEFLVRNGLKPYIEFGNKPLSLPRTLVTNVRDTAYPEILRDQDYIESLIYVFFRHLIHTYGVQELSSWKFEFWFDELAAKKENIENAFADHCRRFERISGWIHSLLPNVMAGGFGMKINDQRLPEYLQEVSKRKRKPDFLSFQAFPYEPQKEDPKPLEYTSYSDDKDYLEKCAVKLENLLTDYGLDKIPVYITEYNMILSARNYFNDSCCRAAYMLYNLQKLMFHTDCLGFFNGSDLSARYTDSTAVINGSPGFLTKNGIAKPVHHALSFLHQCGTYYLASGDNYILTSTGHRSYYLLCFQYHFIDLKQFQKMEDEIAIEDIRSVCQEGKDRMLTFQLENCTKGSYIIEKSCVNFQSGSLLKEWENLDWQTDLRPNQLSYLKQSCSPRITIQRGMCEDGKLVFDTILKPYEVSLIHIYYNERES